MKWFIKVLRHYADFSGRARRKEYWMFVLFNMICAIVWIFLTALAYTLFNNNTISTNAVNVICLSYGVIVMLPSMAVTVRRLHDVGKSGWMLLVALIPAVGGIWLFLLLITKGQQRENKYGFDPKISPDFFSEPARLKSAGNTMIIAGVVAILSTILQWIILSKVQELPLYEWLSFQGLSFFVADIILLIAGIVLLFEKQVCELQNKGKVAVGMLLAVFLIYLIFPFLNLPKLLNHISEIGLKWTIFSIMSIVSYLLLVVFALLLLFEQQNKKLICNIAIWVIVFRGLLLLFSIQMRMNGTISLSCYERIGWSPIIDNFLMIDLLVPVAYIVLTGTFLMKKPKQIEDNN